MEIKSQVSPKNVIRISIADDFSRFPAGRYSNDGDFNGTRFREEILAPRLKGLKELERVVVSLDGVAGFGSSFLEEAFGGLIRDEGFAKSFLDQHLEICCEDEDLQDFAKLTVKYIEDAAKAAG